MPMIHIFDTIISAMLPELMMIKDYLFTRRWALPSLKRLLTESIIIYLFLLII